MVTLKVAKSDIITPLLTVSGALDRKQPLPILSHLLLRVSDNHLLLTATDLEIEITARIPCQSDVKEAAITVSAKKCLDIIRSLDDEACPELVYNEDILSIKVGRSSFKLATLSADDFPMMQDEASEFEMTLPTVTLIRLLQYTQFAMSQQDVRVFLNSLCLMCTDDGLVAVATDGHRMAIAEHELSMPGNKHRLLVPRKAAQDMLRLLQSISDETVVLSATDKHMKLSSTQYTFSSKMVEARFPPYSKAIPQNQDKLVQVDRDSLKRALSRIVILANEKSRAILLELQQDGLTLVANNQEKEEALETVEAALEGEPLKIGVNAGYLLDVLAVLPEGMVQLSFSDAESSILVTSPSDLGYQYIIMPMKI